MSKKHHATRTKARALRKYLRLKEASDGFLFEAEQEEQDVWRDHNARVRTAESQHLLDGSGESAAEVRRLREEGPHEGDFARRDRLLAEGHAFHVKACAAAVVAGLARVGGGDGKSLVWQPVRYPRPEPTALAGIPGEIVFGDVR